MNLIIPHGFETNYTLGFLAGLKENGVEFVVISSDADESLLRERGIASVNLRRSVTQDRSKLAKFGNLARYYLSLARYLFGRRGGTLHFTGVFRNELLAFEGLLLPPLFRLLSRRYIYTAHNVLPHGKGDDRFHRAIYRWIYRFPHTIVVNTALAGEQIASAFGIPRQRIRVSSIGFNDEVPSTGLEREAARQRLGLASEARVLLFFGKIGPYKGLDLLIEAFGRLQFPGSTLVIAGEFTDTTHRAEIIEQIGRSARRADIVLHERHVPNDEVEVFFEAADCLVLPYRQIYQSGLIFLAMRFGLPVVATDVGSMKAYLEPDAGLVTASNDAAGLAAAIEAFFEPPGRFDRRAIVARGREYGWGKICHDLRPLYELR